MCPRVSDVSRYAGELEHVFETVTAGVTLQSPQLDINTVAAGGGSRLFFRNGLFAVGWVTHGMAWHSLGQRDMFDTTLNVILFDLAWFSLVKGMKRYIPLCGTW